jgi:hypothetical protein
MNNLSGLLDRRVRLERPTSGVQQKNGAPAKGWETYWTGRGGKRDENLIKESEDGKQIVATGRTKWTLRYQAGLNPKMRLVDITNPDDEVIYNIEGISEVGRKEAITLQTERHN